MNTKDDGNPGKRLLGFLHISNLLPVDMMENTFSITNVRSKSDKKLSGFGYLTEGNLLCPCISKNNKPYFCYMGVSSCAKASQRLPKKSIRNAPIGAVTTMASTDTSKTTLPQSNPSERAIPPIEACTVAFGK